MISRIFYGLGVVTDIVLNLITLLIIASVAISWFNGDPNNQYVQMVRSLTEPMYRPFRRFTRRIGGPIDFAPMLVMLIIVFLHKVIPGYLMALSIRFG